MRSKSKLLFTICGVLLAIFVVFTIVVAFVDKSFAGESGASVGLSLLNRAVFECFGTSRVWHIITELLGYLAFAVALGFALLGLYQLVRRKGLFKVDVDILLLAGLYAAVAVFYVLFEAVIVNYRPILVDGVLEASYPSSHTMLFCTVLGSAPVLINRRLGDRRRLILAVNIISALLCTVMAVGRLLSGMHWFTDIIAALLLSAFLITLYMLVLSLLDRQNK